MSFPMAPSRSGARYCMNGVALSFAPGEIPARGLQRSGDLASRCDSRVAFDVRAQLGDRAEPHRSMRKLGLDRSVGVKRVGHALDDPGLQDRSRLRLLAWGRL